MFPQNGDLKKQLHERQPRIAALSDKQVSEGIAAPPGWGGRVAGHFGGTLKSASLGAARSDSQRGLPPVLKVPHPSPFLERKSRVL